MRNFGHKGKKGCRYSALASHPPRFVACWRPTLKSSMLCKENSNLLLPPSPTDMKQQRQQFQDRLQDEGNDREDDMEDAIEHREEKHKNHHSLVIYPLLSYRFPLKTHPFPLSKYKKNF